MGYILIKQNGKDQYFVNEYIIDSVDDLQTINVTSISPGSKAYLLKDNKKYIYILDTQKLWKYAGEEGGGGGGGGGTTDYSDLSNKPKINSITLEGNKNSAQLGLQDELDFTYKDTGSPLEIVDYPSRSDFPVTGDSHIIYHALDTNIHYEWTGTTYQEVYGTLALGETEHTAYRGDRGKTAYDHSQTTSGNPHNVTANDVGLGSVGNFKAVSTEANQELSNTEKTNARNNIGAGTSSFSGAYNDLSGKPTIPIVDDSTNTISDGTHKIEGIWGNDDYIMATTQEVCAILGITPPNN